MEEIKIEVIDILINSIINTVLNSEMDEEGCETVIYNSIYEISDMMDDHYGEILIDRFENIMDNIEEEIHDQEVLDKILKDLGWESKQIKNLGDTEHT